MEIAEKKEVEPRKQIVSVDILGASYKVVFETEQENPKLKGLDGYCDWTALTISINKILLTDGYLDDLANKEFEIKKVIRHELIHAFLMESGMTKYSEDEVLVEWIAAQFDKIDFAIKAIEAY